MPSPPKLPVVIEEIEDENSQPVVTTLKPRKRRAKFLLLPPTTGETMGVDGFTIQTVGVDGSAYAQAAGVDRSVGVDESQVPQEKNIISQVTQDENNHPMWDIGGLIDDDDTLQYKDKDYVVDQFSNDDEYCMDDYVVEEEVPVEHEVEWIAKRSIGRVKVDKKIKAASIRQRIDEECKVEISKYKAYAAIKLVREMISGSNDN
ncbi:hypothetical protein M9H77_21241 [Catharanthus roseus]|uniref:Uncharacterized protein n=1 Tax=Catharanthus roseus TaxID=4058 RepID=A0ACC0ALT3_CATRO|nr:hypothetical protein M9H77_21241 [Catharanthus roseus]